MFRTKYEERTRVYANPGSPVKVLLKSAFDKAGKLKLIENGKVNLYNEIQSHADSVDLQLVLKKYAAGDTSALFQREGTYGDFTGLPTTYAGILNLVNDAEQNFKALDPEIRAKFHNNFGEYVACMDNPKKFAELMGMVQAPENVEKVPEVKKEAEE